jgi:aryl-alcohol dehydrogenase-like predicted oxidoreductase
MKTANWKAYQLSRLMLGTVQFGLPYGIANQTGQPDYREILEILEVALAGGVNCFDTAAAYGTSEELLGRALQELRAAEQVVVVTKVRPLLPAELADAALAEAAITSSVETSRQRLQLDCLPVVLFHREADAAFLPILQRLQGRGWLRYAGVSCDNRPGPAATFVTQPECSALQIPGNLADRRHLQSGSFRTAAKAGCAVFVRSVYLQGLLVMPQEQIPISLQPILPFRRNLEQIAQVAGMPVTELAVRYMLAQPGVTCVLTGVETASQMRENLRLFDQPALEDVVLSALDQLVPDLPEAILTPGQWPKLLENK